jgi:hypothetical protein
MRTAGIDLNKPGSARSSPQPPPWPRVIKRGRRNSYRIKRPRDTITRHDPRPKSTSTHQPPNLMALRHEES